MTEIITINKYKHATELYKYVRSRESWTII